MTAEEARKITDSKLNYLEDVFSLIRNAAESGIGYVYVTYELSNSVLWKLNSLGYSIENASSLAIQKDNWHHKISWY